MKLYLKRKASNIYFSSRQYNPLTGSSGGGGYKPSRRQVPKLDEVNSWTKYVYVYIGILSKKSSQLKLIEIYNYFPSYYIYVSI